jgi:hypothetical protein
MGHYVIMADGKQIKSYPYDGENKAEIEKLALEFAENTVKTETFGIVTVERFDSDSAPFPFETCPIVWRFKR